MMCFIILGAIFIWYTNLGCYNQKKEKKKKKQRSGTKLLISYFF